MKLGTECAASCWGSGAFTHQVGEEGSGTQRAPWSSTVAETWPFGEGAVELEVRVSAGTTSTFCCSVENTTSDCMALLKVSWCWTSWRTHFDRPECKHTWSGGVYVDNYCHLLFTGRGCAVRGIQPGRLHRTCDVLIWVIFVAVIHQDQCAPVIPVADAPVTGKVKGWKVKALNSYELKQ